MKKRIILCLLMFAPSISRSADSGKSQKYTDNIWYEAGLGYERIQMYNPVGSRRISDANALLATIDLGGAKWRISASFSAMPGEVRGNIGQMGAYADIGKYKKIYLTSGIMAGWLEYRQNEYRIGQTSIGTRRRHGNTGIIFGAGLGQYSSSYMRVGATLGHESNSYSADVIENSFHSRTQIMKDSGPAIGLFGQGRLAVSRRFVFRADMAWGAILRNPLFYTPKKSFNFSVGAMMLIGPKTRLGRPGIDVSVRTDDRESASNSGRRLRIKGLIRKEKK